MAPERGRVPAALLTAMLTETSTRGIAREVADLIGSGRLPPGARLPTVRALAAGLQVGPTTIAAAWSILKRRQLIRTSGRNGTFIRRAARRIDGAARRPVLDLSLITPDPVLVPRLSSVVTAALAETRWTTGTEPIDPVLYERLIGSWPGSPESLTAVAGARDGVNRIADAFLGPGDRVLVEEFTSPLLLEIIEDHGAVAVPVACDTRGPLPDALAHALDRRPAMLLIQPRMADPYGHVLTPSRGRALARLLRGRPCAVVEVDVVPELATSAAFFLAGLLGDQAVVVRSWNLSHGTHLGVGVVGGSGPAIAMIRHQLETTGGRPSPLSQRALALMLADNETRRVVASARCAYRLRRDQMIGALRRFGVSATGATGLAVCVRIDDADRAVRELSRHSIVVSSGPSFAPRSQAERYLRIATTPRHSRHHTIARILAGEHPASERLTVPEPA